MRLIFTCFYLCFLVNQTSLFAQSFSATHHLDGRTSYSIFFPTDDKDVKAIIILIHALQMSNPSAYGEFINDCMNKGYIVLYPAYQDYTYSNNKRDIKSLEKSIPNALEDIKMIAGEDFNEIPYILLGHSMGAPITWEIAERNLLPTSPKAIVSIAPADVRHHHFEDVLLKNHTNDTGYLIIEEEKDRHYRRGTGKKMKNMLDTFPKVKYTLHHSSEIEKSSHMQFLSYNKFFTSNNNSLLSYFSRCLGKKNTVDTDFYWKEIHDFIDCILESKDCFENQK